jgi:hypothetical protein
MAALEKLPSHLSKFVSGVSHGMPHEVILTNNPLAIGDVSQFVRYLYIQYMVVGVKFKTA